MPDGHVLDRAGAERVEHHSEQLDQGMGGGGDRDPVGGVRSARASWPAPGERVQGVVVGEADAARSGAAPRPRATIAGRRSKTLGEARDRALTSADAIRSARGARTGSRPWIDSADGVGTGAATAAAAAVPVPQASPAHVRRGGRPGAGRAHAAQRGRARQGAPRLPVRGLARHRQDLDGEDPRGVPELRARTDDRAVRGVRLVCVDRARQLARRDRDGRGVEQLGRRHPRAARERRLRARCRGAARCTSSTRPTCSRQPPGTRS